MPKRDNLHAFGLVENVVVDVILDARQVDAANTWQLHIRSTAARRRPRRDERKRILQLFPNSVWCCRAVKSPPLFRFTNLPRCESGNSYRTLDPDGKFVIEPVREREEVLYAELSPALIRGPRWQLDVAGHYARPDVFELTVNREGRPLVRDRRT